MPAALARKRAATGRLLLAVETFEREFYRGQALVASSYDATVTAPDPNPNAVRPRYSDPVLAAMAVNRLPKLTLDRRPILTLLSDGFWR
jgi:hypothetical protein